QGAARQLARASRARTGRGPRAAGHRGDRRARGAAGRRGGRGGHRHREAQSRHVAAHALHRARAQPAAAQPRDQRHGRRARVWLHTGCATGQLRRAGVRGGIPIATRSLLEHQDLRELRERQCQHRGGVCVLDRPARAHPLRHREISPAVRRAEPLAPARTPGDRVSAGAGTTRLGWYAGTTYKLGRRWIAGARYDYVEDPLSGIITRQVIPSLTLWQSEWVELRAQYTWAKNAGLNASNQFALQAVWAIGPHKHETY